MSALVKNVLNLHYMLTVLTRVRIQGVSKKLQSFEIRFGRISMLQ